MNFSIADKEVLWEVYQEIWATAIYSTKSGALELIRKDVIMFYFLQLINGILVMLGIW